MNFAKLGIEKYDCGIFLGNSVEMQLMAKNAKKYQSKITQSRILPIPNLMLDVIHFLSRTTSLVDAEPTLTHMSLVKLQQKGLVRYYLCIFKLVLQMSWHGFTKGE